MAIDKSKWNTNVKVSQKTIDEIKKMGMAKALKTVAGASAASKQDSSAKEWTEGVKRLYGANRVASAVKKDTVKYSSADAARGATSKPKSTTKYKSADSVYASSKPKATNYKSADSAYSASKSTSKPAAKSASVQQKTLTGTKVSKKVSVASKPKAKKVINRTGGPASMKTK